MVTIAVGVMLLGIMAGMAVWISASLILRVLSNRYIDHEIADWVDRYPSSDEF